MGVYTVWIDYYTVRWWSCENRYVLFFGSFSDLVNQQMLQINSLNVIGSKWLCLRAKVCSTSSQSHSAAGAFALPLRDSQEEIGFAREHKRQQQLVCFPHLRAENWKKVSASEFRDDDVDELRFQPFFQGARRKSWSGRAGAWRWLCEDSLGKPSWHHRGSNVEPAVVEREVTFQPSLSLVLLCNSQREF